MLDLIKENDAQRQGDALAVIKAAYGGSDDEWIKNLESKVAKQSTDCRSY